jgi:hypothetical protein
MKLLGSLFKLRWRPDFFEWEDCPRCKGSGYLTLAWDYTRHVTVWVPASRIDGNTEACPLCGATKRIVKET